MKLHNLEVDTFLETCKLNIKKAEILNISISSKEVESVITDLSTKKSPRPDGLIGEFYQTFEEKLMHILLKFFLSPLGLI